MKRPSIPVRDGIWLPRFKRRTTLVDFGAVEYRTGFWMGMLAGVCWGVVVAVVVMEVVK